MLGTLLMIALIAFAAMALFRMLARKQAGPQPAYPGYAGQSPTGMPACTSSVTACAGCMAPDDAADGA